MVAWSIFRAALPQINSSSKRILLTKDLIQTAQKRHSGGHDRVFNYEPSRWLWHKTKDWFHFYFMVGAIPLGLLITYCNVYIGPATLKPIPEGYTPRDEEYERLPISRWIVRHRPPRQEHYEKALHIFWVENRKRQIRLLEKDIKQKMKDRRDYQAWYYTPVAKRAFYRFREELEKKSWKVSQDFTEFNEPNK